MIYIDKQEYINDAVKISHYLHKYCKETNELAIYNKYAYHIYHGNLKELVLILNIIEINIPMSYYENKIDMDIISKLSYMTDIKNNGIENVIKGNIGTLDELKKLVKAKQKNSKENEKEKTDNILDLL